MYERILLVALCAYTMSGRRIESLLFATQHLRLGWFTGLAIPTQASHPANVLVHVVASDHVHDFACIFLSVLVLELIGKAFVSLCEERVGLAILIAR